MLERPERTLNVLLLLILIAQLTSASLLGALLERSFGSAGLFIGLVLQIVLYFVIGEVAPKTYAIQNPDRAALRLSGFLWAVTNFPPLRLLSRGLIGLANVMLPGKGLKQAVRHRGRSPRWPMSRPTRGDRARRTAPHPLDLSSATPSCLRSCGRARTCLIDSNETVEAAIEQTIGSRASPCYEDDTDNIIGIVYLKDLVHLSRRWDGPVASRCATRFVPSRRVAGFARCARRSSMAIVRTNTAALGDPRDLLEEIVGEIVDEYDIEGQRRALGERYPAPGRTHRQVNEPRGRAARLSGTRSAARLSLLGHVPDAGGP
jgi:CBS domain containing-hemolysin-like protein